MHYYGDMPVGRLCWLMHRAVPIAGPWQLPLHNRLAKAIVAPKIDAELTE